MELNKAQKQVVEHGDGPLLVIAGAGTGKTRVIVERIGRLLKQGIEPKQILAVTFTEKAAAEMLDRILQAVSNIEVELPVMTFNAFGESLLRTYNTELGLSRAFLLMGDSAKLVFLRQHLEELELDYFSPVANPEGLLPDLADYFSKLKQHVVTPAIYDDFVNTLPNLEEADALSFRRHKELALAYKNYLDLCLKYNVIDYDDQIFRVIELLKTKPHVTKELQSLYKYIMIDEFQDTNPMQSQLIDLLVNKKQSLMVVGDDDQSIYGFRGATLANILEFNKRYPKAKNITLDQNYRSSQTILDASYRLIQHNNPNRLESRLGIVKKLTSSIGGSPPILKQFDQLDNELYWLGEDIAGRIEAGENPGSIAVLCRRNTTAEQVSQTLTLAGVKHVVIGEKYQLYNAPIVRTIVEALKAIVDPRADISLHHTLTGPLFNLGNSALAEASSHAKRHHETLETSIKQLDAAEYTALSDSLEHIKSWRNDATTLTVGRLVYKIIDESGYKDRLYKDALESPEAALLVTQLSQFFRTLKDFESIALQPSAVQYVESFPVLAASGETSEDSTLEISTDRVNILTIHKAKGLEWDTVYIPDCTEGSFPLRSRGGGLNVPEELIKSTSSEADSYISEERRLMYVAVTRAKYNLQLSFSQRHYTPSIRKPSRFVTELFEALPTQPEDIKSAKATEQFALFSNLTPPDEVPLPLSLLENDILKVSVSQVVTYFRCPLDFYYRYILQVPDVPNAAAAYGTALHSAIEKINEALHANQPVDLKELQQELRDYWPKEGYISKSHRERALAQGLKSIEHFYKMHVLEESQKPHLIEWPFSVHLKPEDIILRGRYDVVFDNDGIEIRDYKTTMSVDTPEKAKRRATSSEQLTLYALVWQELQSNLPAKLSLEFVDTGLVGSVGKTKRGITGMRVKLAAMADDIRARNFKPGKEHRYCVHPEV
jgi:DNA helicase II / ATP-dependent DNA helicase PcrA